MTIIRVRKARWKKTWRLIVLVKYNIAIIKTLKSLGFWWYAEDKYWYRELSEQALHDIQSTLSNEWPIEIPEGILDIFHKESRFISPGEGRNLSRMTYGIYLDTHRNQLLEEFASKMQTRRYSRHSIKTYVGMLRNFLGYFHTKDVWDLGEQEVEEFNKEIVMKGKYSNSYQRQLLSAILLFYRLAGRGKMNFAHLERPRKERKLPTIYSKTDIKKILASIGNLKHKTILSTIYGCGLRISESVNLRMEDVDFNRKMLTVRAGKGKKDRMVNMGVQLVELIKIYMEAYKPTNYLFPGINGGKYSVTSIQNVLKRAKIRAAVTKPGTVHTLRHSFATHLLEAGVGLRYIQEILGHNSSKTTEIYTHVSRKKMLDIRNPLDDLDDL